MQEEREDQDESAVALYHLAVKYDMPAVTSLAKDRLLCSLKSLQGEAPHTLSGKLDPWMLAHMAAQVNDSDLSRRSMSTICEPLRSGGSIAPLPISLTNWVGPVVCELVSEVNKAVIGIPEKLSFGETRRALCLSLASEVRDLKGKCKQLESSKGVLKSQVEKLKQRPK